MVCSFYPLRYFNPFAIYDGQAVRTSETISSTYRVPTMETVFVFCVVHVCEMGAPLIYVSIYTLVTKTICFVSTGYKNNSVTKTYRERLQKRTERVGYKKGYKSTYMSYPCSSKCMTTPSTPRIGVID